MLLLLSISISFVLGVVDLLDASALCDTQPNGSFLLEFGRTRFILSWVHKCSSSMTEFSFVGGRAPGWVAFGLCDREGKEEMAGCEFFQFNSDLESRNGGNNTVNAEPKALAVNMMQNVSISVVNASYNVRMSRAWAPVDSTHVSLAAKRLRVMASFGPTNFFGVQHFGDARFTMSGFQQLFSSASENTTSLITTTTTTTITTRSISITSTSIATIKVLELLVFLVFFLSQL
jgi:hypothetical protein